MDTLKNVWSLKCLILWILPPWKYLLEKWKKYMHLLNQIHAMYCWEGLLVIQHFWRSDFFKRCWISSSISQTISKNAQKKKWWLFFFTVYVLIMCFVWLFQIMVLTCSDVTWIFPIAWQNGQKGKKNDHKHIAVSSTLCNTPYRWFFFFYSKFRSQKISSSATWTLSL